MASTFKLQVPADIHCLIQLLARLGLAAGPMKAARVRDDQIDIWFVPVTGIKRAKAHLVRGNLSVSSGHPRRVYLDLRVQISTGQWQALGDEDYRTAGLLPPWEYYGQETVNVEFDVARSWAEIVSCGGQVVATYYRWLPGDEDRAISEAHELIASFHRGE